MAPIERDVCINGYWWREVFRNSTQAGPVYEREYVEACGGNPTIVQGKTVCSTPKPEREAAQ